MTPWDAGTEVGPYTLIARAGSGGMGEVWKARDRRLDRIVAIKRLHGQRVSASSNTRFEQEARAIAALNHPNICQIYDVGPDYLVLEYIEGQPLVSKESPGPVPVDEAVKMAVQIAAALEEAHGRGITHRDLKPDNILKTRAGIKVLDFGLAKLAAAADSDVTKTVEGTVMGTAAYMSPEQAQGKSADARSDIFSFGAVLYEVLAGRRAFTGDSMAAVLTAVLTAYPAALQAPPALARIVTTCLRKAPADRFQTVAEVKKALEQIAPNSAERQSAERQPSIAVLPFANMSSDKEQEYFSDGLAEEIINVLAHVPGLNVTARTSAFSFKGKDVKVAQIAHELGVEHILEGSVRKSGNRIRITAQLIKAADGFHLWSERYDRELNDIFAVQDEISSAIAGALQLKLSPQAVAKPRYTPKLPAYEAYLKAHHYQWQLTLESLARAKEHYERAITLDPGFALAHSGYADYFLVAIATALMPASEAIPRVRSEAQKALDLDPSLPEAHAMLAAVAGCCDHDWNEAERQFRLAMAHEPVPPLVRFWYAYFFLTPLGQQLEAVEQGKRAIQEDPLNPMFHTTQAMLLNAAARYAEAEVEFRQALDLDPSCLNAYLWTAGHYLSRGMPEQELANAEKAYSLAPWLNIPAGYLAGMLMRTGDAGRAQELLHGIETSPAYKQPMGLVYFHLCCSEPEKAADWLERAIEVGGFTAVVLLRLPIFDVLRVSPRWPALAKMMNLPE
ncbi:MAG TPA: protein kinase [Bryobacteraceae bacterium]|nr:protein kinase [Bryobacteraceae bacterium]